MKRELYEEEKIEVLNNFMIKLKMSGYNEYDRFQILRSGMNSYQRLRSEEEKGLRPFYRPRSFDHTKRKEEKQNEKKTWYKRNSRNNVGKKFSSVFFVPVTPGSALLKMLKETEEKHQIDENSRIKFVETSGRKYADQLKINDPFEVKCDPQEKCITCQSNGKVSNCKIANVGYSLICKTCKARGLERTYEGETCRNTYLRGREHVRDYDKRSESSVMYKHVQKEHKGEEDEIEFQMKVVGRFKTAITRQIDESVRIQNKKPSTLLNSKSEFHGPAVKRKVLEGKKRKPGNT